MALAAERDAPATAWQERLDRLFDELHRHGIDTTPQAQAMAGVVLARGLAEGAAIERLAYRVSVLLAADEHEQLICRRAATHTLHGAAGPVTYSDAEARVEGTAVGAEPGARRFWWALGLTVVTVLLWVAVGTLRSPVTVEAPATPGWRERVEQGFDEPFALPQERFTVVERLPHPARPYVVNGLAALPLIAFAWLAHRWWRRRVLWFRRSSSRLGTTLAYLGADPQFGVDLLGDRQLAEAGTALARGAPVPTPRLDVLATVRASARHVGALRPVFATGRSGSTTYVVLIERKSGHDHMARLADMVVDRFVELGVRCERYSFHDDPRGLTSDGPDHRFTTLQELARRLRDEKLVIIGAADGFFHPLRGDLEAWVASLRDVRAAALLSAAPFAPVGDPRRWSHAEMALLERGFTLATATRRGLLLYGDHVAAGTADPMRLEGRRPASRRRRGLEPRKALVPETVTVAGGRFLMGAPETEEGRTDNEGPQHEVAVPSFAMGRYPVTFDEYDHFCAETGREKPEDEGWGRRRRPVINVSWGDAKAYVAWLAEATGQPYRLPSEAEWEYACRAGTTARYAFGDEITPAQASFSVKLGKSTEVGAYPPNAWGLFDMHGNVWEWVEDCWHGTYEGAPDDGSAWLEANDGECSSRVLRGGSWLSPPGILRSAGRLRDVSELRYDDFGFRVARTLTP